MEFFSSRSLASLVIGLLYLCGGNLLADDAEIKSALTLHASFDNGINADFSKGDKKLYTWIDRKKNVAKAGLHTDGKSGVAKGAGKFGSALEFKASDAPWIFYQSKENLAYKNKNCAAVTAGTRFG